MILLWFPLVFPHSYLAELMISFLPYLVVVSLFLVVVMFVHIRKDFADHSCVLWRRWFGGIVFLLLCLLFWLYSKQFNAFYRILPHSSSVSSGSLRVLFANMYKNNASYHEMEMLIASLDPDMLMFVEFAPHHYDILQDFLKTHYPYTNNISWSKTFVGSMVFSKYPISNKATQFPQWTWRYGYYSINHQWHPIYFYLVHTSSPDSYQHFVLRNTQLHTLTNDMLLHHPNRTSDHVVVAWDFNTTPWSSYYRILDTAFSGTLVNVSSRIPFLFTWKLMWLPLFQAHIDHVWVSNSLHVPFLRSVRIPGSDHKGFLFELGLETK